MTLGTVAEKVRTIEKNFDLTFGCPDTNSQYPRYARGDLKRQVKELAEELSDAEEAAKAAAKARPPLLLVIVLALLGVSLCVGLVVLR